MKAIIPIKKIETKIYLIRRQKVMLDRDLADLYEVKAIRLREQVKRNIKRFPNDFMFQLTKTEAYSLVSQNAIPSKRSMGGYMPYVFTEQGVAMLSTVLNSERAIEVNIQIMRAFIKIRKMLLANSELKALIEKMEKQGLEIESNKEQIHKIATIITQLLTVKEKDKRKIGF